MIAKRVVLNLSLLMILIAPVNSANAAFMRNIFQACAFGAGIMATTTYVTLVPELSTGVLALPVSEVILTNAILGCSIGVVGTTAAAMAGWFYDSIF